MARERCRRSGFRLEEFQRFVDVFDVEGLRTDSIDTGSDLAGERQADGKRGAPARFALHGDRAAVIFDDPLGDRETETDTFAFFGGEKRLENLLQVVGIAGGAARALS